MSTGDGEFRERREEKIAEIRRTGKTWQWPDPVPRRDPPDRQPLTWWDRFIVYAVVTAVVVCAVLLLLARLR